MSTYAELLRECDLFEARLASFRRSLEEMHQRQDLRSYLVQGYNGLRHRFWELQAGILEQLEICVPYTAQSVPALPRYIEEAVLAGDEASQRLEAMRAAEQGLLVVAAMPERYRGWGSAVLGEIDTDASRQVHPALARAAWGFHQALSLGEAVLRGLRADARQIVPAATSQTSTLIGLAVGAFVAGAAAVLLRSPKREGEP